jgi:hypothetical protein
MVVFIINIETEVNMINGDKNNSSDGQHAGSVNCRARVLGLSQLVECNTKVDACGWHFPFGEGLLCSHPSNSMIAKGSLLTGWSLTK